MWQHNCSLWQSKNPLELDHKESRVLKNWCFWTVVLEKTLESPLHCKEIKLVNPKGNQPWIFIGRTDTEAETPTLWPPDAKNWLTGKDPDAGKDWGQEEKGTTEDETDGWHHWLKGHKFEQALGVGDGQGSLACCSPQGRRVTYNWATELNWRAKLKSTNPSIFRDYWVTWEKEWRCRFKPSMERNFKVFRSGFSFWLHLRLFQSGLGSGPWRCRLILVVKVFIHIPHGSVWLFHKTFQKQWFWFSTGFEKKITAMLDLTLGLAGISYLALSIIFFFLCQLSQFLSMLCIRVSVFIEKWDFYLCGVGKRKI